jgi:5-methylcytosine-specific restriction protein A
MPTRPPIHRSPGWISPQQRDRERGTRQQRGYDAAWQRVRLVVLAAEPLCRFCDAAGRIEPATEVDHIDGNSRNNDRANLRPLCKPCHSRRTARDQGFARGGG